MAAKTKQAKSDRGQGTKKVGKMTMTLEEDRTIIFTREFNAPRTLVFEAYTKPEHITRWWGPRRYSTIVDKMDVRPGGVWRFINRDAEGQEFGFNGVYREVVPPTRIVQTFEFEGMPGHVSVETATFEERNGKTIVTSKAVFASAEDRAGILQTDMAEGFAESMDRLEELLQTLGKEKHNGRKK